MAISEGNLLEIRLEMEELITGRESMIAENLQRQNAGHSMAYVERDFFVIEGRLGELRNTLIQLQGG